MDITARWVFSLIWLIGPLAHSAPATFTYQGRILSANGDPLKYGAVAFEFTVLSPDKSCVIYREQLNSVNMSASNGVFDVLVGSGAKSFPTGPGFSLVDAFNNTTSFVCKDGAAYTPSPEHGRLLRVQFFDGTSWKLITPDMVINSVPYASFATLALKLESYGAADFLLKNSVNGNTSCGAGSFLTWDAVAQSFGCAAPPASSGGPVDLGTADVTGTLPLNRGGTGATSQSAAINNLLPGQSGNANKILQTDGANVSWVDVPTAGITALTGEVTASGTGSVAATLANNAVTSAKILDGTIVGADMDFGGVNTATSSLVMKDAAGKFSNFACATAGHVPTWTVTGFACQAPSLTEVDPKVASVTTNMLAKWNGSQLVDSAVHESGGNVGLGTATPQAKLDVNGGIRATEICDETGANCKDISSGWGSGASSLSGDVSGAFGVTSVDAIKGKSVVPGAYSTGQVLRYDGGSWVNAMIDISTDVTGTLPVTLGGTGAVTQSGAINNLLPSQTGHANKILQTDGADVSWVDAPIADGAVTSAKIQDGTVVGADMDFTGSNAVTSSFVMKDSSGKFFNFACAVVGQVPTWTAAGFDCQALSITETDPKIGLNTLNMLSKWDGNQLVASGVYESGGNVGIGTATPQSTLDVNGIIRATEICDETGANCKDISSGWGSGASSLSGDVSGALGSTSVDAIKGKSVTPGTYSAGQALRYNGSNWVNAMINISTDVTGTLPVTLGGTGAVTQSGAINNLLPSQTGHASKILQTDGTDVSWVDAPTTGITALTGEVTASGSGSVAATIATNAVTNAKIADGAVTSAKILNGTIVGSDMDFTGANAATSSLVMKDSAGKFFNFACSTVGHIPAWTAGGFACQALTETDPKIGANTLNMLSKWDGSRMVASTVYENGGSVGVGTTSPSAKLDVRGGSVSSDTSLKITKLNSASTPYSAVSFEPFITSNTAGSETSGLAVNIMNSGASYTAAEFADNVYLYQSLNARSYWSFFNRDGNNNYGAFLYGQKSRGTYAAKTAVQSGDDLFSIVARGYYNASNTNDAASIFMSATQNFTSTAGGGKITFATTPNGSTTLTDRMTINQDGNVGIATSTPRSALDVNGAITSKPAVSAGTSTVDFAANNLAYTNLDCQSFSLWNLKDGGTYSFAVMGTNAATCEFTAYSGSGSGALSVRMPPDHAATTAGKATVYSLMVMGTTVFVTWIPGY